MPTFVIVSKTGNYYADFEMKIQWIELEKNYSASITDSSSYAAKNSLQSGIEFCVLTYGHMIWSEIKNYSSVLCIRRLYLDTYQITTVGWTGIFHTDTISINQGTSKSFVYHH